MVLPIKTHCSMKSPRWQDSNITEEAVASFQRSQEKVSYLPRSGPLSRLVPRGLVFSVGPNVSIIYILGALGIRILRCLPGVGSGANHGCSYTLGVLLMGALIIRALYLGSIFRPLFFGNFIEPSSNEVTLNSSCGWEYTIAGLHSGLEAIVI